MAARKSAKRGKSAKGMKKAAAAKAMAPTAKKITSVKDAFTKSQTLNYVAERTGVKRNNVGQMMEALTEIIEAHVKKGGPGSFTVPGLMKLKVVRKPATKARKGINPFTGEPTTFKAKPARNVIKIKALKSLKEMV